MATALRRTNCLPSVSGGIGVAAQRRAAALLLDRKKLRDKFTGDYVRRCFNTVEPGKEYKHNWHIDYLCEILEACRTRQLRRVIINMPFRSLKSITCTVSFPSFLLGADPSEQIMAASYSGMLSKKHSLDTRAVLYSGWYKTLFPETVLADDQNEKMKFMTTQRGHRIATSVGGSSTGEGGNFLIADDPVNSMQALSDVERETANNWLDQTFMSRQNDQSTSVVIVVMQRFHVMDPSGYLLQKGGWEHIKIPLIAPTRTIIDFGDFHKVREKDDVLHEARFPPDVVEQLKLDLGSYGFAGQLQQTPVPLGGGRLQLSWFPRHIMDKFNYNLVEEVVHSYDTASKGKEINNPTGCMEFSRIGSQWYITDAWKERLTYPALKKKVKTYSAGRMPNALLIEDKSSGMALIQELNDDQEFNVGVIAIEPEADKITRMDVHLAYVEAGRVSLPDGSVKPPVWLHDLEHTYAHFPAPAEWEYIDCTSQFLKWVRKRERDAIVNSGVRIGSITKSSSFYSGGRV